MKKIISSVLTLSMLLSLIFTSGALAFLKGDLNGDDMIDNKDVVALFKYVSGTEHAYYESAYDVNDDGVIDNKDVVFLFRNQSTMKPTYEPTPQEYFGFEQKSDGTYEIRPADINDMPETLIIPDSFNGVPVTSIGDGAFQGCTYVIIIIIIGSIENIGAHAFDGCVNLKEVVMPKSLQTVGEYAFSGCTELTSVTFSGSVSSIGKGAFSDCVNLENASLPNSVTEIGANAFYNCTSLKNVSLGNSLVTIGDSAFAYCIIIIIIIIPENVEFIGEDAFAYCSSLKTVVLGGSLTVISEGAFRGCESLQSIDIPDSVTEIGANAFSDCTSLETVTIGSNVTRIGDGAFSGCILIVIIIIPANVRTIGINAFDLCTALTRIIFETVNGWYVDGSPVSAADLSDPEKAAELIKSIYSGFGWAIQHEHTYGEWETTKEPSCTEAGEKQRTCSICGVTETETIPALGHDYGDDGICKHCGKAKPLPTSDEYFTFTLLENDTYEIAAKDIYNMPSNVFIPEEYNGKPVTSIGHDAFYGCSSLTSVTIGNGVTSIGDHAFYNCSKLISATLPDSVTSINDAAFYNCSSLTSLNIPDNVTSIGNSLYAVFTGCSNLTYNEYDNALYLGNANNPYVALIKAKNTAITSVIINEKTKIIALFAFGGCSSLTSVTIPDSVTSIGAGAFNTCSNLTSVIIPDSVTSIGYAAFYGCSSLTSVTIPDSVTSIGDYAFNECSCLIYNKYDNALYLGNTNNPHVVLIKAKGTSITSVIINEKTKVICDHAFSDCRKLTSVAIPDSVTSIGIGMFSDCSSLVSITVSEGNKKYHSDGNCIIETESKALIAGCNNSVIPDNGSVTSIGSEAFYFCRSLTSVIIPDGVTSVNDYAFSCCKSLASVTIPDSVNLLSYGAFDNCDQLTSIIYTGTKAQWISITMYYSWDDFTGEYTIHCTDGDLAKGES